MGLWLLASAFALSREAATPIPMGPSPDEVLPDCSCKCCTAEPCQCDKVELVCETDKRDECDSWVGKNFEVRDCNPEIANDQWRAANPFDVRFMKTDTRMKHDDFCADYCKPVMEVDKSACAWIPPPQPVPTNPPDCGHCPCAAAIEAAVKAAQAQAANATLGMGAGVFLQRNATAAFLERTLSSKCNTCCNS